MDTKVSSEADRAPPTDRAAWPTTKGSLSDLERDECDLSATTTVEQRFAIVWQLTQDAWAFRGEPIGEPELSRHIVRVIRRRS